MNELKNVGKSKDHEVMMDEGTKNAVQISKFMISLQNQVTNHEERLSGLEDNMRINGIQEMNIKERGNVTVLKALGGKKSNAYKDKSVRARAYSAMWKRFKRYYGIPRYGELPAKDFSNAIDFLSSWAPDKDLRTEIEATNNQTDLNI